ncbi:hypothetical protein GCM10017559_42840 [Streptosporangium longisporum]|uniref:Uncharacterized protein n=1 Tax=Streptosporangium longisporum TaxID=46187 RepID=A0ABN3Y287_9ACTN
MTGGEGGGFAGGDLHLTGTGELDDAYHRGLREIAFGVSVTQMMLIYVEDIPSLGLVNRQKWCSDATRT